MEHTVCPECYAIVHWESGQLHADWHEWINRSLARLNRITDPSHEAS